MQIVRPKMTRATYMALKKYIMKEREKKKQEQEQDKEQERLKKERELKKKKEEEDSLTLEQTKEQIALWENKLASLKQEKHELFSQLKKVLHQENALKQKTQLKEQQNDQTSLQHQYMVGIGTNAQAFLQQQSNKKYLSIPAQNPPQSLKRSRSPSPTPYHSHYSSNLVQSNSAYNNIIKAEPPFCLKPGTYQPGQTPSGHPSFAGQQSAHNYLQQNPQQQQPGSFQPSTNQRYSLTSSPAFYPTSHFLHQSSKSSIPESQFPTGTHLRQPSNSQRRHQQPLPSGAPAYAMNIPSQMDHPSNKVGFSSDEKLRMPQRSAVQPRSHGYNQQNRY